jgi:hypothetical protein
VTACLRWSQPHLRASSGGSLLLQGWRRPFAQHGSPSSLHGNKRAPTARAIPIRDFVHFWTKCARS